MLPSGPKTMSTRSPLRRLSARLGLASLVGLAGCAPDLGAACKADSDCAEGVCAAGHCTQPVGAPVGDAAAAPPDFGGVRPDAAPPVVDLALPPPVGDAVLLPPGEDARVVAPDARVVSDAAPPDAAVVVVLPDDAAVVAPDAAPPPDASVCLPGAEVCNGADDDCDGAIDEDVCVHCDGAAGAPCNGCPAGAVVPAGWVCAPPGRFMMGSPAAELGRSAAETRHSVTLTRAFLLQATEVTQAEWFAVMGNRPSYFGACGEACPVERVSWYDAAEYLNRRSDAEGLERCYDLRNCVGVAGGGCRGAAQDCAGDRMCDSPDARRVADCAGYRFPTEAEWEYAARAGTQTALWSGELTEVECGVDANLRRAGWYCGNSGVDYAGGVEVGGREGLEGAHPVALKAANPFGLYDVHGGVWEWVNDVKLPYPAGPATDPTGPAAGQFRAKRGGGWYSVSQYARSAFRGQSNPEDRYPFIGFRPARTLR